MLKLKQMGVPWGAFGAAKRIASFCYPFGAVSQSALSRSGSCCKPVCCYRIPKSPIPNPKSQIHFKKRRAFRPVYGLDLSTISQAEYTHF